MSRVMAVFAAGIQGYRETKRPLYETRFWRFNANVSCNGQNGRYMKQAFGYFMYKYVRRTVNFLRGQTLQRMNVCIILI